MLSLANLYILLLTVFKIFLATMNAISEVSALSCFFLRVRLSTIYDLSYFLVV